MNIIELRRILSKYNYSKNDLIYICENFNSESPLCLLRQLYASLNMLNAEDNEYLILANIIEKHFDLNCNVLDICCGHLPVLSDYIKRKQIRGGTITAVDPNLVTTTYGKVNKLIKTNQYKKMIKNSDLIIAQEPCSQFDDIICECLKNKKAFFLTVCGCDNNIDYLTNKFDPYDCEDFDPVLQTINSYAIYFDENHKTNDELNYEEITSGTKYYGEGKYKCKTIRYIYGVPKKRN